MAVQTCNPSYLGGRVRRITCVQEELETLLRCWLGLVCALGSMALGTILCTGFSEEGLACRWWRKQRQGDTFFLGPPG